MGWGCTYALKTVCAERLLRDVVVSSLIPKTAVEAAIKFVKFTSDQIASLYAEFSDRQALAPSLAKIVLLAERKGGKVSTREAQLIGFSSKQRPSSQQVREWFGELEVMKYGKVTTVKKTTFFTLPTPTVPTVASSPDTERLEGSYSSSSSFPTVPTVNETTVGNCRNTVGTSFLQSESLPSEDLKPIVGTVGADSPLSEKSENSLLSSEPARPSKSAAIPKVPKPFEVGDRVVIKDVGGIYQGTRGQIVETWYSRAGSIYLVKFDKPVRNVQQLEVEPSDLMKL